MLCPSGIEYLNIEIEGELQACALQLGVNLEDQQWQELIS